MSKNGYIYALIEYKLSNKVVETILEFQKLQREIPKIMAGSQYKASHFIKELNLTPSTYYRKVSTAKFTPEELLKIVALVSPKEYYRWEFEQEMKTARKEIRRGEIVEYHTVAENIRNRLKEVTK